MLQAAPDTILFEMAAPDDSELTLSSLADNTVAYRASTLSGAAEAIVQHMPVVSIVRRPATAQNGATKYTIKCVHPVFNVVGQLEANMLVSMDVVVPNAYLANSQNKFSAVLTMASAIIGSDLFENMAAEGNFLR